MPGGVWLRSRGRSCWWIQGVFGSIASPRITDLVRTTNGLSTVSHGCAYVRQFTPHVIGSEPLLDGAVKRGVPLLRGSPERGCMTFKLHRYSFVLLKFRTLRHHRDRLNQASP